MSKHISTPEQRARDLLERLGMPDAQAMSSGDVVELANLLVSHSNLLTACQGLLERLVPTGDGRGYVLAGCDNTVQAAREVVAKAKEAEK